MAIPTGGSDVKEDIKLSWAIYGGHISGRRLRGVKINPLYQEQDSSYNEDGQNNKPATSLCVDEIQIETYESLPRYKFPSSSTPNISQACATSLSRVPYVYNGHIAYLGHLQQDDEPMHFSDFSLPRTRSDTHHQNEEARHTERRDSINSDKNKEQARPWSWPQSERGYRKQLIRQSGIDSISGEPDVVESTELLPSTSHSSCPMSSSATLSNTECNRMQRGGTPRVLRSKKRQLSVLHEQNSIADSEQAKVFNETEIVTALASDECVDSVSPQNCVKGDTDEDNISCKLDEKQLNFSDEILHTISFTDGNNRSTSKLYSSNCEEYHFINNITVLCNSYDVDTLQQFSDQQVVALPTNILGNALCGLVMLPTYSDSIKGENCYRNQILPSNTFSCHEMTSCQLTTLLNNSRNVLT